MTLLNGIELFFVVVYAVVSCGLMVLNLINVKYKQNVIFALMQAIISLVLLVIFAEGQYAHVYNYIAMLSCVTSAIAALFGGNEE